MQITLLADVAIDETLDILLDKKRDADRKARLEAKSNMDEVCC